MNLMSFGSYLAPPVVGRRGIRTEHINIRLGNDKSTHRIFDNGLCSRRCRNVFNWVPLTRARLYPYSEN